MISVRLVVTLAELPIALCRLEQAFSEVVASKPHPCDGDAEHVLVYCSCRF